MKNLIRLITLFFLVALTVFPPTVVLAQTETIPDNLEDLFSNLAGLAFAISVVTEFLKKILKVYSETPNILVQALSWLVGIGLGVFGWWFDLGVLGSLGGYFSVFYGLGAAFISNGIADTKIIEGIFSLFGKK